MKEITKEMVINLNKELRKLYCPFIYRFIEDNETTNCMERILPEHTFLHKDYKSEIIVSDYFYEWLNVWFRDNYNIELAYNNTGSICWAKN